MSVGVIAHLADHLPQSDEVPKGHGLLLGIAQQSSRVQGCHEENTVLFDELTVLLGHGKVRPDQPLGGNAAQADHNLRADQPELLPQPGQAGIPFLRQRIPVLGRAAFHDVGDKDIFLPGEIHRFQILIQQLAAAAHKGQALFILILAGALTDEHDLGSGAAHAEHHVMAGLTQAAFAAGQTFLLQGFKIHPRHLALLIAVCYKNIIAQMGGFCLEVLIGA